MRNPTAIRRGLSGARGLAPTGRHPVTASGQLLTSVASVSAA